MIAQKGTEFILTKYMATLDNYDTTNTKPAMKKAYDEYLAYTFIMNSDHNKYGSLIRNLAQQQSLKNTQYPKTLTSASEVLMEHRWDAKYLEVKRKRDKKRDQDDDTTTTSSPGELELSFAQLENACYCCGKKGHNSTKCFKKDSIPREEWYINRLQRQETNKIQQHLHMGTNTSDTASIASTPSQPPPTPTASSQEWSEAHIPCNNNKLNDMKDIILLDNGSTTSIFSNPRMVTNIKEVQTPLQLMTNGGSITIATKATVQGFGEVWYDPKAMANIFSFSELKMKHKITYDSADEDAFLIHLPNKIIRFNKTNEGLYAYRPNDHVLHPPNTIKTGEMNKHHDTIDMATNKNDIKTAGVDRNKNKIKIKNENANNNNQNDNPITTIKSLQLDNKEEITFEMNDNDNDNEPLFENYNYYNQLKWNSRTELNIPKSNQIERD